MESLVPNYETCLRLKALGLPQTAKLCWREWECEGLSGFNVVVKAEHDDEGYLALTGKECSAPTLQEVIHAYPLSSSLKATNAIDLVAELFQTDPEELENMGQWAADKWIDNHLSFS